MQTKSRNLTGSPRLRSVTELREVWPGLLLKFECNHPGGSHKIRAARHIIGAAVQCGAVIPGKTTVIEKTGGNFGVGLALACQQYGVNVELAVGLSFSLIKRQRLSQLGAKLIGVEQLNEGATPRQVVENVLERARANGEHYFYTDQFNNPHSVAAHETETGPEIAMQLSSWPHLKKLTFVSCAGTGASLTGITRALVAHGYAVDVVLAEPAGCDSRSGVFVDHPLEGMAVGVIPPFVDWTHIKKTVTVEPEAVFEYQNHFARTSGYLIGNTSAACAYVAAHLSEPRNPEHKVLSIIYDHGLWYPQAGAGLKSRDVSSALQHERALPLASTAD